MHDLIELFGKLGAGPELDKEIYFNLFCTPTPADYVWEMFPEYKIDPEKSPWLYPDGTPTNANMVSAPLYTTSLDAASELVPKGLAWKLHVTTQVALAHILPDNEYYLGPAVAFGDGKTAALALCLAALRARELT